MDRGELVANVFNRITKQYLKSVNTPDYSESEWIINPKFVPDCKPKYIIVELDNTIREMTVDEKAVVDYVAPPPEPTAEELAEKAAEERRQNIKREIELTYSLTDEIGIIREALVKLLPDDVDVQVWNTVVDSAKLKYPKAIEEIK